MSLSTIRLYTVFTSCVVEERSAKRWHFLAAMAASTSVTELIARDF